MIIALVIAGIYGQDLRKAHSVNEPADSRWVFAEVVAGLSIITAIVYLVPAIKSTKYFAWDVVLLYVPRCYYYAWNLWCFEDGIVNMVNSLFWLILFGIFGKMYLPEDCEGASGCQSMKAAVWFDMLGMIFWFSSAVGKYHFFSSFLLLQHTDVYSKVVRTCSGKNDTVALSTPAVAQLSKPNPSLRFLC